jgi:16S rRNA U516 pseudouridylate synthase RsuA-like enzyme
MIANPRQRNGWAVAGRLDYHSSGLLVLTRSGSMARQLIGGSGEQSTTTQTNNHHIMTLDHVPSSLSSSSSLAQPIQPSIIEKEYVVRVRPSLMSSSSLQHQQHQPPHQNNNHRRVNQQLQQLRQGVYCPLPTRYHEHNIHHAVSSRTIDRSRSHYRHKTNGVSVTASTGEWLYAKSVELITNNNNNTMTSNHIDDCYEIRIILTSGRKHQIRRMCTAVGWEVVDLHRVRIGNVRLHNLAIGSWRYLLSPQEETFG